MAKGKTCTERDKCALKLKAMGIPGNIIWLIVNLEVRKGTFGKDVEPIKRYGNLRRILNPRLHSNIENKNKTVSLKRKILKEQKNIEEAENNIKAYEKEIRKVSEIEYEGVDFSDSEDKKFKSFDSFQHLERFKLMEAKILDMKMEAREIFMSDPAKYIDSNKNLITV